MAGYAWVALVVVLVSLSCGRGGGFSRTFSGRLKSLDQASFSTLDHLAFIYFLVNSTHRSGHHLDKSTFVGLSIASINRYVHSGDAVPCNR
jgi:hypothetical protein